MKRGSKSIEKALKETGLSYEVESHQLLTENCTIDIRDGMIRVNEKPVDDLEDMVYEVLSIEQG